MERPGPNRALLRHRRPGRAGGQGPRRGRRLRRPSDARRGPPDPRCRQRRQLPGSGPERGRAAELRPRACRELVPGIGPAAVATVTDMSRQNYCLVFALDRRRQRHLHAGHRGGPRRASGPPAPLLLPGGDRAGARPRQRQPQCAPVDLQRRRGVRAADDARRVPPPDALRFEDAPRHDRRRGDFRWRARSRADCCPQAEGRPRWRSGTYCRDSSSTSSNGPTTPATRWSGASSATATRSSTAPS